MGLLLISLTSCVHPNRISRSALQRLTKHGGSFVLVFGSLSTSKGTLALATIRFSRQADRSAPEYLLKSLTITSGDRFYAILQAPKEPSYTLPYLDEFYIEVGSPNTGFDRIDYVHLPQAGRASRNLCRGDPDEPGGKTQYPGTGRDGECS